MLGCPDGNKGRLSMIRQLCAVPADSDLKPIYGTGAPGIYELLTSVADRKAATRKRRDRFGEIAYQNVFGRKCVMPMSPETVEPVIMNKDKAFANEPAWDFMIGVAFKRGLLLMDFDLHRKQRLIFQQAFTNNNLKGYLQEMQPMIAQRVETFPRSRVRLANEFKSVILDMALEVFLGIHPPRAEADRVNGAFLTVSAAPLHWSGDGCRATRGNARWTGDAHSKRSFMTTSLRNVATRVRICSRFCAGRARMRATCLPTSRLSII
jgi:cytochrome P450